MGDFDINSCHCSGRIIDIREIKTKTGLPMARLSILCWRDDFTLVAFDNLAQHLLQHYQNGSRLEVRGKLQSSKWEKGDTKYHSFQINISEILEGKEVIKQEKSKAPEPPRPGVQEPTPDGPF